MLGTEAHVESHSEWEVRKWEQRAQVATALVAHCVGREPQGRLRGGLGKGGAPRVLHMPAEWNCASSRHTEPWPSCI